MIMRTSFAIVCVAVLGACSGDASGQKGKSVALQNKQDSISYAFGAQIGQTFREAKMDSLNVDALADGIRGSMDSTLRFQAETIDALVREYQIAAQSRMLAQQQQEGEANLRAGEAFLTINGKKQGVITTASGLQYEVLQAGTGPKPLGSDTVKVHYRGTLIDGSVFDSSYDRGQPYQLRVDDFVPGFAEALQLMPMGSRWKLYIPSNLAYGASHGPGGQLPSYSTLVFEMELLDIAKR